MCLWSLWNFKMQKQRSGLSRHKKYLTSFFYYSQTTSLCLRYTKIMNEFHVFFLTEGMNGICWYDDNLKASFHQIMWVKSQKYSSPRKIMKGVGGWLRINVLCRDVWFVSFVRCDITCGKMYRSSSCLCVKWCTQKVTISTLQRRIIVRDQIRVKHAARFLYEWNLSHTASK